MLEVAEGKAEAPEYWVAGGGNLRTVRDKNLDHPERTQGDSGWPEPSPPALAGIISGTGWR
jgi:hypothetical protein